MENILQESADRINAFYAGQKRMPSYAEMARLFGVSSKQAVSRRVERLVKEGVFAKDPQGKLLPARICNPVKLLGFIKAGWPSPAEEELQDVMSLDDYLISNPQATYLLKVDGDSMIEAGIHEGDLVLVQKDLQPKTGDIVVAKVDDEWTLKYFRRKGKDVILSAANKKYPPIIPKTELIIVGIVIANIRKYK